VLLLALSLVRPSPKQEPLAAATAGLAQALESAVDLATPALRRQRAKELARGHTVAEVVAARQSFGTFERVEPGLLVERAELQVGAAREVTELCAFVPRSYDPARPAPLIAAFHGTGGSGRGVIPLWQAAAERLGALVLAPSEAGPNDGFRFSERERAAALAAIR
jgi:poly(3-hydroxybutyrate) depolymerase